MKNYQVMYLNQQERVYIIIKILFSFNFKEMEIYNEISIE
jgi:hypothetical protein